MREATTGFGPGDLEVSVAGTAVAVRDYLTAQVDDLRLAVADDDVHDARVACRRIRSALLEYLPLLTKEQRVRARQISLTARSLGRAMSSARDAEVVVEVLRAWAVEDGWSRQHLAAVLRLLRADDEPEAALDGLAGELGRLAGETSALAVDVGTGAAHRLGPDEARLARGRAHARVVSRVRRARTGEEDPGTGASWHDVRKAAKRLRYAAEVAAAAGDDDAGEAVDSAKWLQRVLGDLQDLETVRLRIAHAGGDDALERRLAAARAGLGDDLPHALAEVVGGSVADLAAPSARAASPARGADVTLPADTDPAFADYAHPERLVSTQWLADHLGTEGLVVVESDEDVLLYETGHVPGAVKIDWHLDLNDPVTRDYVDGEGFARLVGGKGIGRDTTVVIYGDKNNWWAAYALWVFTLFGHEDVRLLDGGRAKWEAEGREYTTDVPTPTAVDYPVVERDDSTIRAFLDDVRAHLGRPLVDVRSPEEYTGERTHMPAYPEEGALRGGHIPGAQSVPWARAAAEDGSFKRRADLEAIYQGEKGLSPTDDVVAYCRIGERSSHTWFVLTHLLGFEKVRNYDGSWTEWGNVVRVPIVKGDQPGEVPGR